MTNAAATFLKGSCIVHFAAGRQDGRYVQRLQIGGVFGEPDGFLRHDLEPPGLRLGAAMRRLCRAVTVEAINTREVAPCAGASRLMPPRGA